MKVKAFSPGQITCMFAVDNIDNQLHSTGLGITTDKGVECTVEESDTTKIIVNSKEVEFPTVNSVINSLTKNNITAEFNYELPFGYGFGISGASALSSGIAINKLFDLGKTDLEIAQIATEAERINKTGLRDVSGSLFGGLTVTTTKDGLKLIKRYDSKEKLYCVLFEEMKTEDFLTNTEKLEEIRIRGNEKLSELSSLPSPNLRDMIRLSKQFADKVGLITNNNVQQAIGSVEKNNGTASMIMLGHAIFSDTKEGLEEYDVIELNINQQGARLI